MNGKAGGIPTAPAGSENVPDESDYPHPNNAGQQISEGHNNSRWIAARAVGASVDVDRGPAAVPIMQTLTDRGALRTRRIHAVSASCSIPWEAACWGI